jgi:hypothetical protein
VHFFFFTGERKVCPVPPGLAFVVDEWPFFSKVVNQKRGKIFSPAAKNASRRRKKIFSRKPPLLLSRRFLFTPSSVFVA